MSTFLVSAVSCVIAAAGWSAAKSFLLLGVCCVIAAVVGSGLKMAGIEIGVIQSRFRQFLLALVGIALIVLAIRHKH